MNMGEKNVEDSLCQKNLNLLKHYKVLIFTLAIFMFCHDVSLPWTEHIPNGWDINSYCGAHENFTNGVNAYSKNSRNEDLLPLTNPPGITNIYFSFLCREGLLIPTKKAAIFACLLLIIPCVTFLSAFRKEALYLTTLAIGGFQSFSMILISGNISSLEGFALAFSFLFYWKNLWFLSGLFLGISSCFKFLPLVLLVPLVLFCNSKSGIKSLILGTFSSFLLILFATYFFIPEFLSHYIHFFYENITQGSSSLFVQASDWNKSFLSFFILLFRYLKIEPSYGFIIYALVAAFLFVLILITRIKHGSSKDLALIMSCIIWLCLPRLLAYSFYPFIYVIFILTKDYSEVKKIIILYSLIFIPIVARAYGLPKSLDLTALNILQLFTPFFLFVGISSFLLLRFHLMRTKRI